MTLACWTKLVFTQPILLTRKFGIGVNCSTSHTQIVMSQQTDANVSTVLLHKYELFYFTRRLPSATFQQTDAIIHYFITRHHKPSLSQTLSSTVSFLSTCHSDMHYSSSDAHAAWSEQRQCGADWQLDNTRKNYC